MIEKIPAALAPSPDPDTSLSRIRAEKALEWVHAKVLTQHVDTLKPGTVLDMGAGAGRNTLFLAGRGFHVTAVDRDKEAIAYLQEKAVKRNVSEQTEAVVADIANLDFNTTYDNIVSIYALRFLSDEDFPKVLKKVQRATSPGGVNILQDLTQNGPLFKPEVNEHWPAPSELLELYQQAGWEIIEYTETPVPTKMQDLLGQAAINDTATLVARRPLS